MRPVLLAILQVNQEEGRGTCVSHYAGYMSNKHIYARLITDQEEGLPEYIRVNRKRTGEGAYKCAVDGSYLATLRQLEYPEGTTLTEDRKVKALSEGVPEVKKINEFWTDTFKFASVSAVS